jgi:hypothetical protein
MLDRFINLSLVNPYNIVIVGLMLGIGGLILMYATKDTQLLPIGTATVV